MIVYALWGLPSETRKGVRGLNYGGDDLSFSYLGSSKFVVF